MSHRPRSRSEPTAQPAEAYAQGNVIAGQVLAALDERELSAAGRRTTAIALGSHYERGARMPTGFTATHSLAVRISDLERAPEVLDGVITAPRDARRLGNFTLTSSDITDARARAETAARQGAERLAEAARATLGAVQDITREGTPG